MYTGAAATLSPRRLRMASYRPMASCGRFRSSRIAGTARMIGVLGWIATRRRTAASAWSLNSLVPTMAKSARADSNSVMAARASFTQRWTVSVRAAPFGRREVVLYQVKANASQRRACVKRGSFETTSRRPLSRRSRDSVSERARFEMAASKRRKPSTLGGSPEGSVGGPRRGLVMKPVATRSGSVAGRRASAEAFWATRAMGRERSRVPDVASIRRNWSWMESPAGRSVVVRAVAAWAVRALDAASSSDVAVPAAPAGDSTFAQEKEVMPRTVTSLTRAAVAARVPAFAPVFGWAMKIRVGSRVAFLDLRPFVVFRATAATAISIAEAAIVLETRERGARGEGRERGESEG